MPCLDPSASVYVKQKREAMILDNILVDVGSEIERASKWPLYNSAHEGYGVLMEEVRELEEHVFTNQKRRNIAEMRAEAIQVAAVAIRFVQMIDAGSARN